MAAGGGAAVAAAVRAIKASGVVVRMDPADFRKLLYRAADPLVVTYTGGLFSKNYQYLMSYKGLAFFTKSDEPISLPPGADLVAAKSFWMPG